MTTAWPSPGVRPGAAWAFLAQRPWLAGGFLWTGFDYRGEATPFGWPSQSSFFGAMDLCGFAKSAFHIRRALWLAEPVLTIWPHWTFPGQEGQPVPILVASNAQSVSLHLDGQEIARAPVHEGAARLRPVYAPGRLVARAWRDGALVAESACETAGPAVALRLLPDRTRIAADRNDAVPVTVMAVDARAAPCRLRIPALRSPSAAAASSAWAMAIPTWPCPKRPPAMVAARRWRCSTASPR
jgi:beta-galactosidase